MKTSQHLFARLVVFSLLLHAIFYLTLLVHGQRQTAASPVSYIDLSLAAPARNPESKPLPHAVVKTAVQVEKAVPAPPVHPSEFEKVQQEVKRTIDSEDPKAVGQVSTELGVTKGHFSGISDGRTLRDDMREYYLGMLEKFNEKWWLDQRGMSGFSGSAVMIVFIARDGSIADLRMINSSGNPSYDRILMRSMAAAGPLAPLPDTYNGEIFSAPLRYIAPLNLMKAS